MSRPPRGGRGLKYRIAPDMDYVCQSPPSRGAWIEIPHCPGYGLRLSIAPLAGGVD